MSEVGMVEGVQSKDGSRVESEVDELTSSGTPDGVDEPDCGLRSLVEYEGGDTGREEDGDGMGCMIDRSRVMVEGESGWQRSLVSQQDPVFEAHFPGSICCVKCSRENTRS